MQRRFNLSFAWLAVTYAYDPNLETSSNRLQNMISNMSSNQNQVTVEKCGRNHSSAALKECAQAIWQRLEMSLFKHNFSGISQFGDVTREISTHFSRRENLFLINTVVEVHILSVHRAFLFAFCKKSHSSCKTWISDEAQSLNHLCKKNSIIQNATT